LRRSGLINVVGSDVPMKNRFLKHAVTMLCGVLACTFVFVASVRADDDAVLSPGAVAPDPALSPEQIAEPPVLSPDADPPDPALSPEQIAEPPVLSPDADSPDPALSPEQISEPPIPEAN
jgi:hypothetical protein